jgi:hypothetical protein
MGTDLTDIYSEFLQDLEGEAEDDTAFYLTDLALAARESAQSGHPVTFDPDTFR